MNIPVSNLPDEDMQNAPKALVRASKRAWLLAQQTGTEFVIVRNGQLVREIPKPGEIRQIQSLPDSEKRNDADA
jgi:hypothetical protein